MIVIALGWSAEGRNARRKTQLYHAHPEEFDEAASVRSSCAIIIASFLRGEVKMRGLVFVFACAFLTIPCRARIITVDDDGPADFNNIQAAINDSNDGDIIVVQLGIYTGLGNRDIDFCGKAITVRSLDPNDPHIVAATVIDCDGSENEHHRGVYFHSGEGPDAVLEGLTIANGYAYDGGGIKCRFSSSPTIRSCIMRDNVAAADPSGFPGPMPTNGGGIYCSSSSSPVITNCYLVRNIATAGGGAIFSYSGAASVSNCVIIDNAAWGGGAIEIFEDNMSIQNCVITGNRSGTPGMSPFGMSGGAISIVDVMGESYPMVTNCTVTGNSSTGVGGGIYIDGGFATVYNSVVWGNRAPEGPEIALVDGPFGPASLGIFYSDVQWGEERIYIDASALCWGPGNIDADPCFVVPGYWDPNDTPDDANDDFWVDGDYHLLAASPCIDAGDPSYIAEPNETDLDGNPRIVDGNNDSNSVVDMGAYEFFWPPIECPMIFTPQTFNPCSKGNWVKAHFVLPEGFSVEDVDTYSPAKIIEPFEPDIQSDHINVFVNDDGLVEIEAAFPRAGFCGVSIEGNSVEVTVLGTLTSGRQFYGTDTIKIIDHHFECLAVFASYWLQTECGKPDWCGGFDLNEDSVVNFLDFAMFDACCIEIITE
jgi:hypothetical protein